MIKPLISVVMITYGHENFIEEAINGVLMQQCNYDVELIITNDCSPDKTHDVVQKILKQSEKSNRIKYIKQEKNIGMMPNFIFGLKEAKGKYTAICEGDDYWTDPFKLQNQVDYLDANPKFIGCFTNAVILNDNGEASRLFVKDGLPSEFNFEMILNKGGGVYPTASLMFRNLSMNYPDFMYNVKAGDWALMLMLSSIGDIKYLNQTTCVYRKHSGGVFTSIEKNTNKRRLMNINSISFLQELNKYLDYKKNDHITTKISQLSKRIILRSPKNKFVKGNIIYFKQLKTTDILSLLKHLLIRKNSA